MRNWVPSWGYRETDFSLFPILAENETQRVWVLNNLYAEELRVRVSNRYGREPLRLEQVFAAQCTEDGVLLPGTSRQLTFRGEGRVTVPERQSLYSDPLPFPARPGQWIAVTLYIREKTRITCAISSQSRLITRMSCRAGGNYCEASEVTGERFPDEAREFIKLKPLYHNVAAGITQLECLCEEPESIVKCVAFGDSITQHGNWSEALTRRLYGSYPGGVTLVNRGICGNRVVHDASIRSLFGGYFGEGALERFEEDVYACSPSGVDCVLFQEGVNDIIQPYDGTCPQYEKVDASRILAAMRKLASIARAHDSKIYGATIMPFCGFNSVWNPDSEATRLGINRELLTGTVFDGTLDYASVLADPLHPERLKPVYNCGDNLHPNIAGGQALADSIPLNLIMKEGEE